jgi:hypothetical protein
MGAENGHHQVIREANGPNVVIGNDHKDGKSGVISYQVRRGEEFNFEQQYGQGKTTNEGNGS